MCGSDSVQRLAHRGSRGHARRAVRDPATPASPPPLLFALAYGIHMLDEAFVSGGLPRWSTANGFHFTIANWASVSAASFALFSGAAWLVARATWPRWVLVALAVHVSLHALAHLGATVWWSSLSPGALSGLFVLLPLAAWTGRWAHGALDSRTLWRSALLGAATFQAWWDLLVRWIFGIPLWTS